MKQNSIYAEKMEGRTVVGFDKRGLGEIEGMKYKDYKIKIGRGVIFWECPRWHWIPGVCWWPGLDENGNTLKTHRLLAFPRWIFAL